MAIFIVTILRCFLGSSLIFVYLQAESANFGADLKFANFEIRSNLFEPTDFAQIRGFGYLQV